MSTIFTCFDESVKSILNRPYDQEKTELLDEIDSLHDERRRLYQQIDKMEKILQWYRARVRKKGRVG